MCFDEVRRPWALAGARMLTFFGALVLGAASLATLALIVVALGAAAFLGWTVAHALLEGAQIPASRAVRRAGGAACGAIGLAVVVVGALGVRVVGAQGETAVVATALVVLASAGAASACGAAALALGARVVGRMAALAADRRRTRAEERARIVRAAAVSTRRLEAGDDLRDEIASVDEALLELDAALSSLAQLAAESRQRRALAPTPGHDEIHADLERDLASKLELGSALRADAHALADRLRNAEPLRVLLRTRPRRLTEHLVLAGPGQRAALEHAAAELGRFAASAARALAALDTLDARQGAGERSDDGGFASRTHRAAVRRDVESLRDAYAAVSDRVEVARTRALSNEHVADLAVAAAAVSHRATGVDPAPSEIDELVREVARADAIVDVCEPRIELPLALRGVIARSVAAMRRRDGENLHDVLAALRELE